MGTMYGDMPIADCTREQLLQAFTDLWLAYQALKEKHADLQADYDQYRENF